MVRHDSGPQQTAFFSAQSLFLAVCFFLPVALPALIGWLNGLLAVPVFLLFRTAGDEQKAARQIRNGLLAAAGGALLLQRFPFFVFSLTMLPLGYSLHRSTAQRQMPSEAGAAGCAVLTGTWLVFWSIYGIIAGMNPYTGLLAAMDGFLEQIILVYRERAELPADLLYNFEQIIRAMRELLPKVLPGLLGGTVLLTVFLNMLICGGLLRRLAPEKVCWPPYRSWRLPDKAIWLLIFAFALALLGPGRLREAGYCLVIIAVLLYFFQGAAVFVHLLHRWNIPRFFRFLLYGIVALQSYGMLLLAVAGVADVWADFRKLDRETQEEDHSD
ncbi:MAG: DUF2232 domain-containing protein [Candidatus Electrothrix sp. YB6]